MPSSRPLKVPSSEVSALLVYVADLELEVDRLRKYCELLVHETGDALQRIEDQCAAAEQREHGVSSLADVKHTAAEFAKRLQDWHEPGDHHPANDQVAAIALRPLVEQLFAWQQRVHNAPYVAMRLDLQVETIEWFPGRLRHILENLISNALKYRDPKRGETRICVELSVLGGTYELRVSDNGLGIGSAGGEESAAEFSRSSPDRAARLGVGLPVVKLLVEQTGGTMTTRSGDGQGTTQVVVLPRYERDDFLS